MNFRHHNGEEVKSIVQLFTSVFADSEGESEGLLIGQLAKDLFEKTNACDLFNYVADDNGQIVGSIFFSRLDFEDGRNAFILSPVAVQSNRQRKGIGQALIHYGLGDLKSRGVSTVLTYGDPAYYQKVGFRQLGTTTIRAPFELSHPEGWLGQSFFGTPTLGTSTEALSGRCMCVEALRNPVYW